jgi:hypothetical protein
MLHLPLLHRRIVCLRLAVGRSARLGIYRQN